MTPHPNEDESTPGDEPIFGAHMARIEARMVKAMAAHERAMAAAERRMAEAMRRHERAVEAAERRIALAMRLPARALGPMELVTAVRQRRKPPGSPRRRGMEGGEGVPAVPRPKPRPLTGAAAAPIE